MVSSPSSPSPISPWRAPRAETLTLAGGRVHNVVEGSKFAIFPPWNQDLAGGQAARHRAGEVCRAVDLTRGVDRGRHRSRRGASLCLDTGGSCSAHQGIHPHPTGAAGQDTRAGQTQSHGGATGPANWVRSAGVAGSGAEADPRGRQPRADHRPGRPKQPRPGRLDGRTGKTWARWYNIRNLSQETSGPKVSFKLVRLGSKAATSDGNLARLVVGEHFQLHAQNLSQQTLYFNVIDLSSTGFIKNRLPEKRSAGGPDARREVASGFQHHHQRGL